MVFSRFTNLRGSVDTFFSDNDSTFIAASNRLSELLGSTEFHHGLRKRNINWVRIPPYAPSQGGGKFGKRLHERLHPQIRNGKELVRRATMAVLGKGSSGSDVEYVLRDLSEIAPV